MKAKFWENIYRKAYVFLSGLAIPNHFQLEESRAVGQTLPGVANKVCLATHKPRAHSCPGVQCQGVP